MEHIIAPDLRQIGWGQFVGTVTLRRRFHARRAEREGGGCRSRCSARSGPVSRPESGGTNSQKYRNLRIKRNWKPPRPKSKEVCIINFWPKYRLRLSDSSGCSIGFFTIFKFLLLFTTGRLMQRNLNKEKVQ